MLIAGLAFLYLPLVIVAIYSFNASRLVTVWADFSTRWYGELFADPQILHAAGLSVAVAAVAATLATALGTAAGIALARFGRFRGRLTLATLIAAPLVMPEIVTGHFAVAAVRGDGADLRLSQPRLCDACGVAHATLGLSHVAVIVQARAGAIDRALEEAATDLGARPATVFWRITLPLLMPAVVAGWLLAFVLSFDDLVIASFVTGPQATTLPMVVFSAIRLGVSPKINALATLMLAAAAIALVLAILSTRRTRDGSRLSPTIAIGQ